MKKALVTGASGFLGRFLCPFLEEQGVEVTQTNSKNCDLTLLESLNAFNSKKYDYIYHLAAWTQAGDFCLHHPGDQWIMNQKMNTNVLSWFKESQPQAKLIAMGTSCAYSPEYPLSEVNLLKGQPVSSLFTYGMTKRMLYCGLKALNQQYGLKYLYLIPSTLYGPDYHNDGRQLHFIFDLIRKIYLAKKTGSEVILWGDGYQKREVIDVRDFVSVMVDLSHTHENDLFNIGAGKEYSIREFAEHICNELDYDSSKIQYDETKYVGAKSKCLLVEKIKTCSSVYSPRPLEWGIGDAITWIKQNYSTEKV